MANHYDIPKWAGKPPVGTHLDVMKEDKLVQKIMLDEKKCYLFGRNPQMNDICTDHQSCSRVHAAFVYHSVLQRAFLVDLGSSHGTFIGSLKLDPHKPTQLPPNSLFHFGASTRHYIMRERPEGNTMNVIEQLERGEAGVGGTGGAGMLGLSQAFAELDNLTEFNTANNRRISMLGINDEAKSGGGSGGSGANSTGGSAGSGRKKKKRSVTFSEDYELINPEDVDPTVGRFRNMIQTTVVPGKRKYEGLAPLSDDSKIRFLHHPKHFQPSSVSGHQNLYADLPNVEGELKTSNPILSSATAFRLGIPLPDPAPEVEIVSSTQVLTAPSGPLVHHQFASNIPASHVAQVEVVSAGGDAGSPTKRVYAKEAWPGKKQMPPLLLAAPPVNPVYM